MVEVRSSVRDTVRRIAQAASSMAPPPKAPAPLAQAGEVPVSAPVAAPASAKRGSTGSEGTPTVPKRARGPASFAGVIPIPDDPTDTELSALPETPQVPLRAALSKSGAFRVSHVPVPTREQLHAMDPETRGFWLEVVREHLPVAQSLELFPPGRASKGVRPAALKYSKLGEVAPERPARPAKSRPAAQKEK